MAFSIKKNSEATIKTLKMNILRLHLMIELTRRNPQVPKELSPNLLMAKHPSRDNLKMEIYQRNDLNYCLQVSFLR